MSDHLRGHVAPLQTQHSALVAYRERYGWTQTQVARKMNCSQGFVSRFEHGHVILTQDLIASYAAALGLVNEPPGGAHS